MSRNQDVLMEIAQLVVDNSGGRARLVYQEEDTTPDKVEDAAHFIKVDGQRVGRDIELYGFMGETFMGWKRTLADFLGEVLIPVKSLGLTQSYSIAGERLRQLGHEVYPSGLQTEWDALFK